MKFWAQYQQTVKKGDELIYQNVLASIDTEFDNPLLAWRDVLEKAMKKVDKNTTLKSLTKSIFLKKENYYEL